MQKLESDVHKGQFLQSVELFAHISPSELAQIMPLFHLRTIPRQTVLFWEGALCKGFYIIAAGQVRLYETAVSGDEQTLFILRSRDFFDVLTLIDDQPHPVTAVTLTDARLYAISKEDMHLLLHRMPAIANTLLPHLSRMSRQLVRLISDLSFGTVATRLARFILLHIEDEGIRTPHGMRLEWGLSHREIAQFIGTSREVITRAIHQLEKEGIIEGGRGQLLIKDLDKLKQATIPHAK